MFRFLLLGLLTTLPFHVFASSVNRHVDFTHTVSLEVMSVEQARGAVKELALQDAADELPGLIFGVESVNNHEYTLLLRRYSVGVFEYAILTELTNRTANTLTIESRVSFNPEEALRLLTPVADGEAAVQRLEASSNVMRKNDMEAASFSLMMLEQAMQHDKALKSATDLYGSDGYVLSLRLAQERILFEVMKDIYISFMVPTIRSVQRGAESRINIRSERYNTNNPYYQLQTTLTSDLPLIDGALTYYGDNDVITGEEELEFLLLPYQEKWGFITIELMKSRLHFCTPEGYGISISQLRPPYVKKTGRREPVTFTFGFRSSEVVNDKHLNVGGVGVCIGHSPNNERL